MIYIPIRIDAAAKLSQSIYQLTRPPAVRNPNDVSTYYCEWIPHLTRAEVGLIVLPENETIPVHVQADGKLLEETFAPFIGVELTKKESDDTIAAVKTLGGQRVNVATLIPASWQPYVMDKRTAIASGWLTDPEQPK